MQQPKAHALTSRRVRYQQGSVVLEKRKTGPSVWIYRWRDTDAEGRRVKRKQVVGTKIDYPSKAAAMKVVEGLRLDINTEVSSFSRSPVTVDEAIAHYCEVELGPKNDKTALTKKVYLHHLNRVVSPRWGMYRLRDVKAVAVEKWLSERSGAPGTKSKTKAIMSALFQHAMRHEFTGSNPIRLVRQSSAPVGEKEVLTPAELAAIFSELRGIAYVLVLLDAITGIRRGELIGLKWEDISFEKAEMRIVRSVVDQIADDPKTLASRRPVPLCAELLEALTGWKEQTPFAASQDWVFASPHALGKRPYWPDSILKKHVQPAAVRAGIQKQIGWHSFRRTVATLLHSSGASVKTTQELLGHSSPVMTLGTYAKAITEEKREAQRTMVKLFELKDRKV
jgi:integrase